MFEQRDIVLIPFPYSDLTGAKLRPALIISNSSLNKTEDRICCLVTSNPAAKGLQLDALEKGTLARKSWVKPQILFTVHEKIIKKRICTVTPAFHEKIVKKLDSYIARERIAS